MSLPETNPALELARKARKEALQKAQAAAEEKARNEQVMEANIQYGLDQLFHENADNPQWWLSGDTNLWLSDVCAALVKRAPELKIDSERLCLWISGNASIQEYMFDTYKAAQDILEAVDDIPDYEIAEPDELVKEVKRATVDADYKWLIKPLVLAQQKLKAKQIANELPSRGRRKPDPARIRQLGLLTSTLVDLLVNWNQKFGSAKDLYAALFARGVTQPEDFEFVEHAYEVFQVMQTELKGVAAVIPTVISLRAAFNASEPLMKLKTQDARMEHVIRALSQPMIQKYIRNAKIQKWAIPGAIGGAVALFSILGSLRWLRRGPTQNLRSRQ